MARVDLHNHLLFDLDDGARDQAESLELAAALTAAGWSDVVVTPHARPDLDPDDALVAARLSVVQQAVDAAGIALRLHRGREHHLTPEFLEKVRARRATTLGSSNLLLVELPFAAPVTNLAHAMFELRRAGYRTLIAHPERCAHFVSSAERAREVVENGGLLQVELGSLAGFHGTAAQRLVRRLLDEELVSVVATDLHHRDQAGELLGHGLDVLRRHVGPERLRRLTETAPRDLLEGSHGR
jgi:protein-tyrosine phosphatase